MTSPPVPTRPSDVPGSTIRLKTGCGNLYAIVGYDPETNYHEVIVRLGKSGGCAAALTEALGRIVSLAHNYGAPLDRIINQLQGISCPSPYLPLHVLSCPDALAKILKESNAFSTVPDGPSDV